jgi:hypothetical protein
MVRRYEVCDDHDADYFGRGGFLSMEQLERIRVDMVPAQVRDDTTRSMPARSEIPGTLAQASVLRFGRSETARSASLPGFRPGKRPTLTHVWEDDG